MGQGHKKRSQSSAAPGTSASRPVVEAPQLAGNAAAQANLPPASTDKSYFGKARGTASAIPAASNAQKVGSFVKHRPDLMPKSSPRAPSTLNKVAKPLAVLSGGMNTVEGISRIANSDGDDLETYLGAEQTTRGVAGLAAGLSANPLAAGVGAAYATGSSLANRGQDFYAEHLSSDGKSNWSDMAADGAFAVNSAIGGTAGDIAGGLTLGALSLVGAAGSAISNSLSASS